MGWALRNSYKKQRDKGFTIVEVLIVLAIAGLIMVVVFLAVPQLQRNNRNNTRKTDARFVALQRFQYNLDNETSASIPPTGFRCDKSPSLDSTYLFCGYVRKGIGYYKPENVIFHSNTNVRPASAPSILNGTYYDAKPTDDPTDILLTDSYLKCSADGHSAEVGIKRDNITLYVIESGGEHVQMCINNGLVPKQ